MQTISIDRGLRDLQAFLRREWRLALPIALAFLALPSLVVNLAVAPYMRAVPATMEGMRVLGQGLPGWAMPLTLAGALCTILGALALMTLVLVPRVSVGEAIATALRRLPAWVGGALVLTGATFVALIVLGLFVGSLRSGMVLVVLGTFAGIVAASPYMILVSPLIVDRRAGPVAALRQGWGVWRGGVLRAVGGLLLFLVGWWIVGLALQLTLGSVLLLAGRALGQDDLGRTLLAVVAAAVMALQWGSFYLLVAFLYRQRVAGQAGGG